MRPRSLAEFVGQEHLIGPGRLLRRAIEADRLFSSLIFWGPPGCGKTTLAYIIAGVTQSHFASLSVVLSGVKDIREVVAQAQNSGGEDAAPSFWWTKSTVLIKPNRTLYCRTWRKER